MEGDAVSDLVWQLAVRIFPSGAATRGVAENGGGQHQNQKPATLQRAHQYAMRIIGSRIAPSLANDEAAMAEAIKRQLVQENRSADALSFADLHRRLSSYSGPGAIENRWSLLYLLRAIAEDQRRERSETRGTAIPYTSTLSGAPPSCFSFLIKCALTSSGFSCIHSNHARVILNSESYSSLVELEVCLSYGAGSRVILHYSHGLCSESPLCVLCN